MSAFAVLTTLLLFSGFAVSDVTYPSCNISSLGWTYNSLSQSPCEVASYLQSTCWQGGYGLWPLEWQWVYVGPTDKNKPDSCLCNTIAYSVLCACGACQDHTWISWQEWVTNCSTVLPPSTFPNPIPAPIAVPHWALIDVTLENYWNPVTAQSAGDSPEIGPGAIIGASTSSTGPTGSTTPSSGGGSSNTKAIIGGVVGAAATLVIAIVILGTLYLRRRRRRMNTGAREVLAEDETIASSSMLDPPLTSTPRRTYEPSDPQASMLGPEMRATPWTPDVSSQVVSGPHQGSGITLPVQPSSESPPPYSDTPAVPAQPQTPTPDQSRSPRLRQK